MAGQYSQQEFSGPATTKFSPRKFSEKIALLNKKEAEGNAEFEEIIKEVQATTKRVACNGPTPQVALGAQQAPCQYHHLSYQETIAAEPSRNLVLAAAAAADDELEEVYQNLMSCQYDDDKDIADSSSEVSSSARDQIEDIERSIREDTEAPIVIEHHRHQPQAVIYTPKPSPLQQSGSKYSGFPTSPIYPNTPEQQTQQGYYRDRGTSVGSTTIQQEPQAVICYGWQAQCNDYLKPDRLQWQKSSSDPALNSVSHKLPLALQPPTSIHGSCSEYFIQTPLEPTHQQQQQTVATETDTSTMQCYNMLEQRQDLPGIKICAIEDLEATNQGQDQGLGPSVIVHAGGDTTVSEKDKSSLPDIAKLQFSGSTVAIAAVVAMVETAEVVAPAEQHSEMSHWPMAAVVRPSQMDLTNQQQQNWSIKAQVSPISDLSDDMFEPKPVNCLLSSSECGLQYNRLGQYSNSNTSSTPVRHHHHSHHHHSHHLASSVHQQRLKATTADPIIRSHSHNNISYVTKQRRHNWTQTGASNRLFSHHHHHHLQHHQLHQHQSQKHDQQQQLTDYEHHMGQFGLQVYNKPLEGAKSASTSSVRPQYGSISPINSPVSQPTSPQSETNQSSPAADLLGCTDSYLPYSCGASRPLSDGGELAPLPAQVEVACLQQASYSGQLLQSSFVNEQQAEVYNVNSEAMCQQQEPGGQDQFYKSPTYNLEEPN